MTHPSLLFDTSDLPALRAAITVNGSVQKDFADQLRAVTDRYLVSSDPLYVDCDRQATSFFGPRPPRFYKYDGLGQKASILTRLGLAYQLWADSRYSSKAIDCLFDLAASDWWSSYLQDLPGAPLWRGETLRAVALAYDMVAPQMTTQERQAFISQLSNPAAASGHLWAGSSSTPPVPSGDPDSNQAAVVAAGNGLALLAIQNEAGLNPALDPVARLSRTQATVQGYLASSFGEFGDGMEGIGYSTFGLRAALAYALALRRSGGSDILSVRDTQIPRWLLSERIPDRFAFVPRNDSYEQQCAGYVDEVAPLLFAIGYKTSDPVMRGFAGRLFDTTVGRTRLNRCPANQPRSYTDSSGYLHVTHGELNFSPDFSTILYYKSPASLPRSDPGSRSFLYPEHGLAVLRTGFSQGQNDAVATFEARRAFPAGTYAHRQADVGTTNLYAFGARLLIDGGYGHDCGASTCVATATAQAVGHNVVVPEDDPDSQAGGDPFTSALTIPLFLNASAASYLFSDLRTAYASDVGLVPWAERRVYFGRGASGEPVFLFIGDRIKRRSDGSSGAYMWQVHTDHRNTVTLPSALQFSITADNGAHLSGGVTGTGGGDGGIGTARMELCGSTQAGSATPTCRGFVPICAWKPVDCLSEPDTPEHWIIADRRTALTPAGTFEHLAVMAATKPGQTPATVEKHPVNGGLGERVTWSSGAVVGEALVVERCYTCGTATSNRVVTDATFAKATVGRAETVVEAGNSFSVDGVSYFSSSSGRASVIVSGATDVGAQIVVVGASPGTHLRIFVPASQTVTGVTVNGTSRTFSRSGDQVLVDG